MPNGAQTLVEGLVDAGVDVCFANPGTSEMHFVAALDEVPGLRAVLCLFEGVATGAADGYGRMTGKPASTLLHLGPGLANGLANLHNARRAGTPVVNVVGDHALPHKRLDAPLESDIGSLARTVSGWTRRTYRATDLASDAAEAVAAAYGPPGSVATLLVPADVSWSEAGKSGPPPARTGPRPGAVSAAAVEEAARALRSTEPAALLLGGAATHGRGLRAAARIAAATGARLLCETFPARLERGAGLPAVGRLAYREADATAQLAGARLLLLAGAAEPVTFFAYPGQSGRIVPDGCRVLSAATGTEDVTAALEALAELVQSAVTPLPQAPSRPERPTGALTGESAAAAIGALLPDQAIVVDEANTSGIWLPAATAGAPPHDWLTLTGGAIGQGLPAAVGAALAAPGRPVLALEADGSAMYTLQALWTMAREQLDITVVLFDNRAYSVLKLELQSVGATAAGPRAGDLLDLSRPDLDFVALARGMGVPAERAVTAEQFTILLDRALAEPGPCLIDCVVPPLA
ncbi:acetolactate synthase large subunit [Streptomyces ortus]|uniref:Acetolactate synthase large subunit n=1 Tax=Streptomyces ortus TaxID=2867268 RepID=A0ABT3VCB7_9ACTN|nr:acetolactate synthase large subunit [Streptomyces ortus]MCX4237575.1 acetolactate synthase large subunit [Streptomyces ortus]